VGKGTSAEAHAGAQRRPAELADSLRRRGEGNHCTDGVHDCLGGFALQGALILREVPVQNFDGSPDITLHSSV
jgi:hypothetical protein